MWSHCGIRLSVVLELSHNDKDISGRLNMFLSKS